MKNLVTVVWFLVSVIRYQTLKVSSSQSWLLNPLLMATVEVNGVVARLRVILGDPRGPGIPACPFAGPILGPWLGCNGFELQLYSVRFWHLFGLGPRPYHTVQPTFNEKKIPLPAQMKDSSSLKFGPFLV